VSGQRQLSESLALLMATAAIASRLNSKDKPVRPDTVQERVSSGWYVTAVNEQAAVSGPCAIAWCDEVTRHGAVLTTVCGLQGRVEFDPGGAPSAWVPTRASCRGCVTVLANDLKAGQ
jgi:hypothetical protein